LAGRAAENEPKLTKHVSATSSPALDCDKLASHACEGSTIDTEHASGIEEFLKSKAGNQNTSVLKLLHDTLKKL
jgi:hypothetical protein